VYNSLKEPGRLRLVIDCDPGHDDALAILLAARHTELVGVTTVGGNVGLDRTTTNALKVLDLIGRADVPVHAGSSHPLVGELKTATNIHGESGLAGPELPVPSRPPTGIDAVTFLVDTINAEHAAGANDGQGLWLVVTGPMTNVAQAFTADPSLPNKVAGVSFMGGSTHVGNWSAVAEFNIWGDPEAADVVVRSGVPLIMAGLNITHTFQATPDRVAKLGAVGTRPATLFAGLLAEFSDRYRARQSDVAGAPMHDPLAVLALTHPELFVTYDARLDIEIAGTHTKGMTIVDQRSFRDMPPPNCRVLKTVDADAAFALIVDAAAAS
jgi:inosine-uridine nucleoside N-ribohydrolase